MLRITTWTCGLLAAVATGLPAEEPTDATDTKPDGREIFERVWTAGDARSHGGDGLGPVFNAASCVACHDQGGAGGGGAFGKNVQLLTFAPPAIPTTRPRTTADPRAEDDPAARPIAKDAEEAEKQFAQRVAVAEKNGKQAREAIAKLHPAFAKGDTIVVHAKGVDEKAHADWRSRVLLSTRRTRMIRDLSFSFEQPVVIRTGIDVGDSTPLILGTVDGATFPVLAEMTKQVNALKGKATQSTSITFPFQNGSSLTTSQRNTTALWGAGRIDAIPDAAIEAIAERQREAGGRVSGRPHRLADGRLGRFGWKGQKASLHDFTIAACANELGLEVPGAHQAAVAYDKEHEPEGLDLDRDEVRALVDYLSSLPAPIEKSDKVGADVLTGRGLFGTTGCAACHVPKVGDVDGLYSDLLLHDMGPDLGAVGSYGAPPRTPEPDPEDVPVADAKDSKRPAGPTSREWRTAPLWGVASSAPYMHDGRARTLEQAIAFHGGEAAESRLRYMLLKPEEKRALQAFLGSLVAPEVAARTEP